MRIPVLLRIRHCSLRKISMGEEMTGFLECHMPTAQFIFDAACTVIFAGSMVAIYAMLLA